MKAKTKNSVWRKWLARFLLGFKKSIDVLLLSIVYGLYGLVMISPLIGITIALVIDPAFRKFSMIAIPIAILFFLIIYVYVGVDEKRETYEHIAYPRKQKDGDADA